MYLVQIISLLIIGIVIACSLVSFKKTVIIWTPLSLLFNPQVCVLYQPQAVSLSMATNVALICVYLFNINSLAYNNSKFELKTHYLLMIISLFLTTLMSSIPIAFSINSIIKTYVISFTYVYIFFKCMTEKKDVYLFAKTCLLVAFLITIDGIIEFFTNINLAGDFIFSHSPQTEDLIGRTYYVPYYARNFIRLRYGMTRCYSFFNLHISFGVTCIYIFYLLYNIYLKRIILIKLGILSKWILPAALILLLIGVVCSNSKTPMLGAFFVLLAFYSLRRIFTPTTILLIICVCVTIALIVPNFINNLYSLGDEELAEEGGGSSVALRVQQLKLCMNLFYINPLFGSGIYAAFYYSKNVSGFEGILGAESVWLQLLADQGLLGCIAYLSKYYAYVKMGKNIIPKRILNFFLISVLVMETVTGSLNFVFVSAIIITLCVFYQKRNLYV